MKVITKYSILLFMILYALFPNIQVQGLYSTPNSSTTFTSGSYTEVQSVTYQVEVNFSLTHNDIGNYQYLMKFSRFDNRTPNSTLTKNTPPFQESNLTYSKITGTASSPFYSVDKFNNTYDVFNNTLSYGESITLDQKYLIKLNEISFSDVDYSKIQPYDNTSIIFNLYCIDETYYEKDDPVLNNTSHEIVDSEDNPIQKAIKICNWVSDYLTYDGDLPSQEYGAKWAYDNQRGDCSEYSTLMVTLLRCQGIPARKATGYIISNNPTTKPQIGQTWNFAASNGESNILGHAWVEYYVEGIGWIACDPTWNADYDYVNRIDYLRLNLNVGAWFSIPGGLPDESEFPHPCIVYNPLADHDYQYSISITVIDTDLIPIDLTLILLISISSGIVVLIIIIVAIKKRKKRKKVMDY